MLYGPSSTSWFLGSSSGTRPASPGVLPERKVPPGIATRSSARGAFCGLRALLAALAAALVVAAACGRALLWQPPRLGVPSSKQQAKAKRDDTALAFPLDGRQTQPQMLAGEVHS